jgi:hypothetical protein
MGEARRCDSWQIPPLRAGALSCKQRLATHVAQPQKRLVFSPVPMVTCAFRANVSISIRTNGTPRSATCGTKLCTENSADRATQHVTQDEAVMSQVRNGRATAKPLKSPATEMVLPVPLSLKPIEAEAVDELPRGSGWLYEPKYDGFRFYPYVFRGRAAIMAVAWPKFGQSRSLTPSHR